ncbi:MAG: ASCH domain-containing protein, partial [Campylobacteraceae bacterium]|nr:ASCH domain-containing protein [Campylobacteraceae bacterium]
ILSGKKTITIRDESEKNYAVNSIVEVSTYEDNTWFCSLKIKSVERISYDALSSFHAEQENMTLEELKNVIQEIYPGIKNLYILSYDLI